MRTARCTADIGLNAMSPMHTMAASMCFLVTESEAKGPGRQRAEQGQWFRLHNHGKSSTFDAGIVKVAVATMDKDVRREMYEQPLLSLEKFRGKTMHVATRHHLCWGRVGGGRSG